MERMNVKMDVCFSACAHPLYNTVPLAGARPDQLACEQVINKSRCCML